MRAVETRSLADLAATTGDRLRREQLEGGTLTLTNLGMYGTEKFNEIIINPPQSAILAVGAARPRACGTDGALGVSRRCCTRPSLPTTG